MANCVMCGSPIPDDQGSKTCSMCYGDIDHGKDGYYREYMEEWERQHHEKELGEGEESESDEPSL